MFVQAKMSDFISEKDLSYFGHSAQRFVQATDADFERSRPNELVVNQKNKLQKIMQHLKLRAIQAQTDIAMVFIYAGEWRDFHRPETTRKQVLENLRAVMPNSRVAFDIWGASELVAACDRAMPASEVVFQNVHVLTAPIASAEVYIGVVGAKELVAALSQGARKAGKLNDQFFVLNPRSFMKIRRGKKSRSLWLARSA